MSYVDKATRTEKLISTANASLLTLSDDGTNQTITSNLGILNLISAGNLVLNPGGTDIDFSSKAITSATNTNWDAAYSHVSLTNNPHTTTLDLAFTGGKVIDGASSLANAVSIGDGTDYIKFASYNIVGFSTSNLISSGAITLFGLGDDGASTEPMFIFAGATTTALNSPVVRITAWDASGLGSNHNDFTFQTISGGNSTITTSTGDLVLTATAGDIDANSNNLKGIATATMSGALTNTLAIGTAPFVITSTTVCTNLNADKVDGYDLNQALLTSSTVGFANLEVTETITFDAEYDNGSSSTADTIDWGNGNKQLTTMTGDCTYTFTAPDGPCNLILRMIHDTSARNPTWPGTVKWSGGAEPTWSTSGGDIDIASFYYNGSTYFGQAGIGFA